MYFIILLRPCVSVSVFFVLPRSQVQKIQLEVGRGNRGAKAGTREAGSAQRPHHRYIQQRELKIAQLLRRDFHEAGTPVGLPCFQPTDSRLACSGGSGLCVFAHGSVQLHVNLFWSCFGFHAEAGSTCSNSSSSRGVVV